MIICDDNHVLNGNELVRSKKLSIGLATCENTIILKWVNIKHLLGGCWQGKPINNLDKHFSSGEKCRFLDDFEVVIAEVGDDIDTMNEIEIKDSLLVSTILPGTWEK